MRLLIRSIVVLTLSLGTLACAQGPASSQGTQEKTMEGHPPAPQTCAPSKTKPLLVRTGPQTRPAGEPLPMLWCRAITHHCRKDQH